MPVSFSLGGVGATALQIMRFAGVGATATVVHVAAAMMAMAFLGLSPLIANLVGFLIAFTVSFIGHARFTFRVGPTTHTHLRRFLTLSCTSLLLSTLIIATATHLGASFALCMLCVAVIIPAMSYLGARFWAFETTPKDLRASS